MHRDPLGYESELSLEGTYYPLGYPLHLATNSPRVLRGAEESWGLYLPARDAEPLRLRVAVEAGDELPTPPVYRGQRHLLTIISGPANTAVCDYTQRFGYCRLSEAAASEQAFVSYYFLEAMAFHMLTQWHVTPVHAACVSGVALCGESGAGKSSLAYACAQRGWTYVSDNESWLVRDEEPAQLIGNPSRIRFRDSAVALFPELRGFTPGLHANGKMSINFRTADAEGLRVENCSRVRSLVFLNRQSDGPAGLTEMPRETALTQLLAGVPMYEPHIRREHERSLRRLIELPVLSLRYSSLDAAIEQLEALR